MVQANLSLAARDRVELIVEGDGLTQVNVLLDRVLEHLESQKHWSLNEGDCFIEVYSKTGLTVNDNYINKSTNTPVVRTFWLSD